MSNSNPDIIQFDNYSFLPYRDSAGMDMAYFPTSDKDSILKLKEQADCNSNCVGFNTYGFLKNNTCDINNFIYLPTVHPFIDGIYLKNTYVNCLKIIRDIRDIYENKKNYKKYTVKLICNWNENLADGWNFMNPAESVIKFVSGKNIQADYYVIINYPAYGDYYVPERTIIFHMEPSFVFAHLGAEWGNPDENKFLKVLSHKNGYNNVEWHMNKHIDLLRVEPIEKTKNLSTVLSNAYLHEGHKLRVHFTKFIDENNLQIDIYGRCQAFNFRNYKCELPQSQKNDALYPYKYSIAVENNSEYNYFTEKLTDCILAECLCFYWGAPNLEDFYPDAFIRLDLYDFSKGLEQIRTAIENNECEKRLPAIRAAKHKILYDMHLTKRLENIIKEAESVPIYDNKIINLDYKLPIIPLSIKTVCINLLRRPDRKESQIIRFNEVGIKEYNFIEAVDGKKLHKNKQIASLFVKNDFNHSAPVIGCALSHIKSWLKLIEDKDSTVYCIFEDDAHFTDKFIDLYPKILEKLSDPLFDWDVVYLGLVCLDDKNRNKNDTELQIKPINKNLNLLGAMGYLINKKGAIKTVDYIKKIGVTRAIDSFINYSVENLNVFEAIPHIVYQPFEKTIIVMDSDISTDYYTKLAD